jgi:prepilin-type processing-associated H-X9-DG protein
MLDGASQTAAFTEWVKGGALDDRPNIKDPKSWVFTLVPLDQQAMNTYFGDCMTSGDCYADKLCNANTSPDWNWKGEYWMTALEGRGTTISFSVRPNGKSCWAPDRGQGGDTPMDDLIAAGSRHPGGVNVCMMDGSVTFISDSVDLRTWCAYGSRNEQETMSTH